jgi:hypothetical protein
LRRMQIRAFGHSLSLSSARLRARVTFCPRLQCHVLPAAASIV